MLSDIIVLRPAIHDEARMVTEERLDGIHRLNHPHVLDDKVAARCDEAVVGRQVLGDLESSITSTLVALAANASAIAMPSADAGRTRA
jgi:hypothetical protein